MFLFDPFPPGGGVGKKSAFAKTTLFKFFVVLFLGLSRMICRQNLESEANDLSVHVSYFMSCFYIVPCLLIHSCVRSLVCIRLCECETVYSYTAYRYHLTLKSAALPLLSLFFSLLLSLYITGL